MASAAPAATPVTGGAGSTPAALRKKQRALEASIRLRQNSSVNNLGTLWIALCYGGYLANGLQLLINAAFGRLVFEAPLATWHFSVFVWAFGNLVHGFLTYRGWFVAYAAASVATIVATEEVALRTGLVFGDYHFAEGLGFRLTDNLPTVVVALWLCLLYPSALLASAAATGRPDAWPRSLKTAAGAVALAVGAAACCVGFDLFSDLLGVTQGHRLWAAVAFDHPGDCAAYEPQPDWAFAAAAANVGAGAGKDRGEGGGDDAAPPLLFLGQVPVQNFVGWFGLALAVHLVFFVTLRSKFAAAQASVFYVRPPEWLAWAPVGVLLCTVVFYLVHPCHPASVRAVSGAFLAVAVGALAVSGHPGHVRKVGAGKLPLQKKTQ